MHEASTSEMFPQKQTVDGCSPPTDVLVSRVGTLQLGRGIYLQTINNKRSAIFDPNKATKLSRFFWYLLTQESE